MATSAPTTARARVRAELTKEIKSVARAHLAVDGASGLSLRAVARELGMASSAVYRYFPSRDDLLTALIIDAYDSMGAAAEAADAAVERTDLEGRFTAVCRAVRAWALAGPHEYGLIYGTPVPGYAAPQDTVAAATRVAVVLSGILGDGLRGGTFDEPEPKVLIPLAVRHDLARLRPLIDDDASDALITRGLMAWTYLFGAVSFELFGSTNTVIDARDEFFEVQIRLMAEFVGLRPAGARRSTTSRRATRR